MLTLQEVKDWLKTFDVKFEHYYIGKLDNKKDKSLGIYPLKRDGNPYIAVGGIECSTFAVKQVSILLHYTKNANDTERVALALYEELMQKKPKTIGITNVDFIGLLVPEPVSVNTDDKGVYEYVIELEIYYER